MNSLDTNNIKWSENVIIADADYIDKVAFNLIVNFERMINRRIQPADMAQWAVCIALDGDFVRVSTRRKWCSSMTSSRWQ